MFILNFVQQICFRQLHNPLAWFVFAVTIVVPVIVAFAVPKKYQKTILSAGASAFSLYLIYAVTLQGRADGGVAECNLELFWTWKKALTGSSLHMYYIVGNIVLFVPLGVSVTALLPAAKCKWWRLMLIGAAVSAGVEFIQYFGHLGLLEWDDIIHNMIGTIIGFAVVKGRRKAGRN